MGCVPASQVPDKYLMGMGEMVTVTRPSHVPLTIGYVGLAYWTREAISPSLQMGRMGGTIAAVNSRYRTAHHNLAQHGEAILFAGGVAREAYQLNAPLSPTWTPADVRGGGAGEVTVAGLCVVGAAQVIVEAVKAVRAHPPWSPMVVHHGL